MNISNTIPVRLRGWFETINARLAALYRLCGCVPCAPVTWKRRSHRLGGGEVMRLSGELRLLEIHRGTVWLTTTPADGDVLLRSGDVFELRGRSGCVLESLEDTEISVSASPRR